MKNPRIVSRTILSLASMLIMSLASMVFILYALGFGLLTRSVECFGLSESQVQEILGQPKSVARGYDNVEKAVRQLSVDGGFGPSLTIRGCDSIFVYREGLRVVVLCFDQGKVAKIRTATT
jgi:hypothetical protein